MGNADSFLPFYSSLIAADIFADGGYVLGTVAVPEPTSLLLAGMAAVAGLRAYRRRKA